MLTEPRRRAAQTGAAITASLVSGEVQIGGLAGIAAMQAAGHNIPITIVAPDNSAPPKGPTAVVAAKDSGINTAKDLNGKTIAVNALQAFSELVTRAAIDQEGGDSKTLKFTVVDFPEMVNALTSGRVQAAQIAEPFLLAAKNKGAKVITYPAAKIGNGGATISVWVAASKYATEHPDVIQRFNRAIVKANELAQKDPSVVRKTVPTYTQIPPPVAAKITLPNWDSQINMDSLETEAQPDGEVRLRQAEAGCEQAGLPAVTTERGGRPGTAGTPLACIR